MAPISRFGWPTPPPRPASPPSALATWARHQVAARALERAAELLQKLHCPVIPVKGVVLARWIYDDVSERPLRDVDLLVPRAAFIDVVRAVRNAGLRIEYETAELGEVLFMSEGIEVELHAEVGRRDLSNLSVDEVLSRSVVDSHTFSVPIQRIDDLDHLLLLAANVVKDYFVVYNPHQPEDLRRMLERTRERAAELVAVAERIGFMTGLRNVASWMAEAQESLSFAGLVEQMPEPPRPLHSAAVRWHRTLRSPSRTLGLALACWTNDDPAVRRAALRRIVTRGAARMIGRPLG